MTKHRITNLIFLSALAFLSVLYTYYPFALFWFAILLLLYTLVLFLGSYFIGADFFMTSFNHGSRDSRSVAITFDDGPNEHTAAILDILKAEGVPATFFLIGKNIAGCESIVERMVADGHSLGGHSWSHYWRLPMSSSADIAAEIRETQTAISDIVQVQVQLFRPPFGVTTPRLASAVRETGVMSIGWSLRSYDTTIGDPDRLMMRLRKARNGDIILLHESGQCTATILPMFIKYIRSQGLEIVTLSKLLKK